LRFATCDLKFEISDLRFKIWGYGSRIVIILITMTRAYEEIIDFIAGGSRPSDVAAFQPSSDARKLVQELIEREKHETLSPEEASELTHYLQLEHLMRLAKARARSRCESQ